MKKNQMLFALMFCILIGWSILATWFVKDVKSIMTIPAIVFGLAILIEQSLAIESLQNKIAILEGKQPAALAPFMLFCFVAINLAFIVILSFTGHMPDKHLAIVAAISCIFVSLLSYAMRWRCYYRHLWREA